MPHHRRTLFVVLALSLLCTACSNEGVTHVADPQPGVTPLLPENALEVPTVEELGAVPELTVSTQGLNGELQSKAVHWNWPTVGEYVADSVDWLSAPAVEAGSRLIIPKRWMPATVEIAYYTRIDGKGIPLDEPVFNRCGIDAPEPTCNVQPEASEGRAVIEIFQASGSYAVVFVQWATAEEDLSDTGNASVGYAVRVIA